MNRHDALAALREDDAGWTAGQKGLGAMLGRWRARPEVAPVLAALERFGEGAPIEACPELTVLFDGASTAAHELVSGLVETGLAGLAVHPLGQLPLRHAASPAMHALLLAHWGCATLSLVAFDGPALAALPPPQSAVFTPVESWLHVLAGSGMADHVLCHKLHGDHAELHAGTLPLQPGVVLYRHGAYEWLQVRSAAGTVVKLRLQRLLAKHEPVREHALDDGALLHRSAARPEDSRDALAMAVLARMGRRDAVPAMSRIATGPGDEGLRWQALRELLTLDARAGMVLLAQVASSEGDPLAAPARQLNRSLLSAWPELEEVARWRA
ncbi:MAG TPA: hypothetical protein VJQ77_08885 [Novosphingobium sp.]|nr:hypothetical protein [Novosphingobium sp.]